MTCILLLDIQPTPESMHTYVHNISGEDAPVQAIGVEIVRLTAKRALHFDECL